MEQQTAADESTELRINGDVSEITRIEAERIHANTDFNVTVNEGRRDKKAEIIVFWDSDMERVNGYHKASVINTVLDCPASVELHSTDEGAHGVSFQAR